MIDFVAGYTKSFGQVLHRSAVVRVGLKEDGIYPHDSGATLWRY